MGLHIYHDETGQEVRWDMKTAITAEMKRIVPGYLERDVREDAGETVAFTRQLEHVFAEFYRHKSKAAKGRLMLPINTSVPNGADSHTYTMIEGIGEAGRVDDMAKDFPKADIRGEQTTTGVKSYGVSYQYTIQDLRRANMLRISIDSEKAVTARKAAEQKLDKLLAVGDTDANLKGFANAAGITSITSITKAATGTKWTNSDGTLNATPAEIKRDLEKMARAIFTATGEAFGKSVKVALGTANYAAIASESQPPTFTSQSILDYILDSSPFIESIEYWPRLDTAGGDGKERIMCWVDDREVVEGFIPQDFEQMPPQARNMALVVNCHFRFGGVIVRYPKAVTYMDGTSP